MTLLQRKLDREGPYGEEEFEASAHPEVWVRLDVALNALKAIRDDVDASANVLRELAAAALKAGGR